MTMTPIEAFEVVSSWGNHLSASFQLGSGIPVSDQHREACIKHCIELLPLANDDDDTTSRSDLIALLFYFNNVVPRALEDR